MVEGKDVIQKYVEKFGELPQLPEMVVFSDERVIELMNKAIERNKELSFEEIANAMYNKYDIVR